MGISGIEREIGHKFKFAINLGVLGIKRDLGNLSHLKDIADEVFYLGSLCQKVGEFDVVVSSLPFLSEGIVLRKKSSPA